MSTKGTSAEFLRPLCRPSFLDHYWVRKSILAAILGSRGRITGDVLDIGCGRMPYRALLTGPEFGVRRYIGLDLEKNRYGTPDLTWDGQRIPLEDASVDSVLLTEVLEHCHDPAAVLREAARVMRPGAAMVFTVPFLWPLHDLPDDYYRYTPSMLERLLQHSGFESVEIHALGGWDASLAQMIGLWVRRRSMPRGVRWALSLMAWPLVAALTRHDRAPVLREGSPMITGLSGFAIRAAP
jgi:SAM-dependent methyltransferase